jgi:hypothetical protein
MKSGHAKLLRMMRKWGRLSPPPVCLGSQLGELLGQPGLAGFRVHLGQERLHGSRLALGPGAHLEVSRVHGVVAGGDAVLAPARLELDDEGLLRQFLNLPVGHAFPLDREIGRHGGRILVGLRVDFDRGDVEDGGVVGGHGRVPCEVVGLCVTVIGHTDTNGKRGTIIATNKKYFWEISEQFILHSANVVKVDERST